MKKVNLQFFAQVIDLTDKLSETRSVIKIAGEEYEVDEGFKTILEVDALMKNRRNLSQVEQLTALFKVLFGEKRGEELMAKNYKLSFYKEVLAAALEIIKGDDNPGK